MATLVLRTVKGSPLTNLEVDGNFSNINTEVGVVYNTANTINSNVGVLSNLTTTAKDNLIAAINEIASESTTNVNITGGTITGITDLAVADGGTGASTASDARTNLGVAIGANVQAWSGNLDAIAALARTDGNFIVGDGSTWVAESGATVRTSLGLGTGNNVTFNNVTASSYVIGDGSLLTNLPNTGAGSGLFNTSISDYAAYNLTTSMANAYVAASTAGYRYIVHSIHVTNIDSTAGEVTAQIVGTNYSNISLANTLPIPIGSSVELLKKPKILAPGDYIQLQESETYPANLHASITVERATGTSHFGIGNNISNTMTTVHTATGNSVIESILLVNVDGTNDVKANVVWTDSSNNIQGYYAYNIIVPADATLEVLEQPKYLSNTSIIRVQGNEPGRLEASIAGKVVS